MVKAVLRAYDWLIMALAIVAGAMMAAVFVAIVVDVAMRTARLQPPYFVSALSEYALLYMTLFAAPWVVRMKGHVFVESMTSMLPGKARLQVERFVLVFCIVLCLVLAYYGVRTGAEIFARGDEDVRSIVIDRWVLFVPLPVGLTLCATEFLRFLIGPERMLSGRPRPEAPQ